MFFISICFLFPGSIVNAQDTIPKTDSTQTKNDTIINSTSDFAISSKVDYKADDSIRFDIENQKVYLFGNAEIKYEDITLNAEYVEIVFKTNQLFAKGMPDSTGKIKGKPIFTQGEQSFSSSTLTYNFKSKKGKISNIITQEGDSYIHGKDVKKFADNSINIRNGQYTTCSDEHPHYEIKFAKARVIPNDKIVSGPAYLVIEDMPTPLALPFGFFPNKKGQKSGILIPTYGDAANRGFFLKGSGYYLGLGDHMDLAIQTNVYSGGSWGIETSSNYKTIYKYNGTYKLSYAHNVVAVNDGASYRKGNDFFINWMHSQDAKARPNSRFTANVNAGSSNYNKNNNVTSNDFLTNTFSSNISYSSKIGNNFNFSANMRHNQNTQTRNISLSLPELTMSMNTIYPFRNKKVVGKEKWFEKISVGYSMNASNNISGIDTILFRNDILENIKKEINNGAKHNIPISSSIKLLKYFTLTNSINYTQRWYTKSIKKYWANETISLPDDTIFPHLQTDTANGFYIVHDGNFSSSINTRLFGMYNFNGKRLKAIRHVITPTASFTYTPNQWWNYYKNYITDASVKPKAYSIFENNIYGTPQKDKSGMVNFSISNNLEMKVRNRKDTITGTKKISLIDNFIISGGYDLAKDSVNFSKVTIAGRTKLFKNLDVSYASLWDPYIVDSSGNNLKDFEWKVNHRLLRHCNDKWMLNLNWSLHSKEKKKTLTSPNATKEEIDMINENRDAYLDFEEQWNATITYSFSHTSTFDAFSDSVTKEIVQTIGINGDISISKKWKITSRLDYDFKTNKLTYAKIGINRDLHCWVIEFSWIPMGYGKSYDLSIHVKSDVLQDLKLTKKKEHWDY
ncbi:MAG TPA: putative LPS assembly protein LptD [Bacteroidales bacterium]|nr:putative LPS assembly protein LptD [Bacteroidales bacterium]HPS18185.1 putative LPS assembly protein LptD [Bacteroidales bacterium]